MNKEQLNNRISELYLLRQQKKLLDERVNKLSKQVKEQIKTMEATQYQTDDLIASVEPRHQVINREQCEIDQFFDEKGLFERYSELTIPDVAIDTAHDAGDITDEDLEWLRDVDTTSALKIERKGDVSIKDEFHSKWQIS